MNEENPTLRKILAMDEIANSPGNGIFLIAKERVRQIEKEGFSLKKDVGQPSLNFVNAAESYLECAKNTDDSIEQGRKLWPWGLKYFKPKYKLSDLVRAGALIAAAIDVLLTE